MKLSALLDETVRLVGADREITGIAYHSARVVPGNLFVAIDGGQARGADFVADALARGAVAVAGTPTLTAPAGVARLVTDRPRRFLAAASLRFFGDPCRQLTLVGVTGTNGKTTTCFLVRAMLEAAGRRPGLVGTVGYFDGDERTPASHTTPESLDLVQILNRMATRGADSAVLEVSSHGLAQDRVWGLTFAVGVFTNLTQDHLDFHRTLEDYERTKSSFFEQLPATAHAVINVDDAVGRRIAGRTRASVISYSLTGPADVRARVLELTGTGTRLELNLRSTIELIDLPLVGMHNAANLAAAAGAALALGIAPAAIARAAARAAAPPGRLEPVANDRGLGIYIDYAHTPDALTQLIRAARGFTRGRVIVVFGAGGDRDRTKRPLMGRVVTEQADRAVITSDNPRREDPAAIVGEIVAGAVRPNYITIIDRRAAIERALAEAQPGDTVLIAGKGHEDYQIIGTTRHHFSDQEEVRRILACSPSRT